MRPRRRADPRRRSGTAARRAAERLVAQDGEVRAEDGRRIGYGPSWRTRRFTSAPNRNRSWSILLRTRSWESRFPAIDIPGKVTGGVSYVQDLPPAGMVHARVVRPPSYAGHFLDRRRLDRFSAAVARRRTTRAWTMRAGADPGRS